MLGNNHEAAGRRDIAGVADEPPALPRVEPTLAEVYERPHSARERHLGLMARRPAEVDDDR